MKSGKAYLTSDTLKDWADMELQLDAMVMTKSVQWQQWKGYNLMVSWVPADVSEKSCYINLYNVKMAYFLLFSVLKASLF